MASEAPKIAFVNLGCRVNRVEVDVIAGQLEQAGAHIVSEKDADLVIVNTCAVTGEAEHKTRKVLRHAAHLPQAPTIVATGCVANLFADELEALAPNIVVEPNKGVVAQRALDLLGLDGLSVGDTGELAMTPTPTGRMRPGIKVQDGCDNRCTFCIVWKARGRGRSLAPQRILAAVNEAVARGAHEVVLTGINLGRYEVPTHFACEKGWYTAPREPCTTGQAVQGSRGAVYRLPELLQLILDETPIERVRLSSIEPPEVTDELLSVMAASKGRIAPFLHVCLQSGCDATLRRMGRVYDAAFFADVVRRSREHMPEIALGTDLIVGFPGETKEEFEQSYDFCREMDFSKMHVFRYSKRPGTPAAVAPHQVPPRVMAERSQRMRELAARMRLEQARRHVGLNDRVLVEYPGRAVSGGLFDVLVDPRVQLGAYVPVRFERVRGDATLVGTLLSS